jgi:hypothetical protein
MQDIEHGVRRAHLRAENNLRQRVHMSMGDTVQEMEATARDLKAHQRSAELMRYNVGRQDRDSFAGLW